MDQAADKIEAHIDRTRERLGSNLRELEERVEAVTDWREQYRARPYVFLGGAFLGGALLAATFRPRPLQQMSDRSDAGHFGLVSRTRAHAPEQVLEVWDNVKSALIAVATTQITQYMGELIPGFNEHYRRTAQRSHTSRDLKHE
jgi:hypothetical protein